MAGGLSTGELIELISEGGPFSAGATLEAGEMIELVTELLRYNAHPDYVTLMVSEAVTLDYDGQEGFKEAWEDWKSPYESFHIAIDEVTPLEDKIVFAVRQIVTTKQDSVGVETRSTAVWWIDDGQILKAAFYLDRQAGMKAAGLTPPDRPPAD
jgi:hypothetical protein